MIADLYFISIYVHMNMQTCKYNLLEIIKRVTLQFYSNQTLNFKGKKNLTNSLKLFPSPEKITSLDITLCYHNTKPGVSYLQHSRA